MAKRFLALALASMISLGFSKPAACEEAVKDNEIAWGEETNGLKMSVSIARKWPHENFTFIYVTLKNGSNENKDCQGYLRTGTLMGFNFIVKDAEGKNIEINEEKMTKACIYTSLKRGESSQELLEFSSVCKLVKAGAYSLQATRPLPLRRYPTAKNISGELKSNVIFFKYPEDIDPSPKK